MLLLHLLPQIQLFGLNDKPSIIETYYNDIFTVPANLAGLPAISLPIALDKQKLPIGVQIMVPRFQEAELFRIAFDIEQAICFNRSDLHYII